jgi:hypothetical protein
MVGVLAIAMLLQAAPAAPAPRADWTPRQVQLIKASNAVMESDTYALLNSCAVVDGKTRYAAATERMKSLVPALERELGSYPVYEIFVLRAPVINPAALPPAHCKRLKHPKPEREAAMARFEGAVSALAAAVEERQ